jgi:uncharacterized protein
MTDTPLPPGLSNDELDELDQILTDLGQRVEEIPQWEFCDGFLAALVCMRRRVEPAEYLPMLLDDGAVLEVAADAPLPLLPAFQDAAQQARFLELWQRRWDEVAHQLAADVQAGRFRQDLYYRLNATHRDLAADVQAGRFRQDFA